MIKKYARSRWLLLVDHGHPCWLWGVLLLVVWVFPLRIAHAQVARSVDMIMTGLATELAQRFPAVNGDVVKVEGEQVYLSLGARDNLLQGTQLTVLREGEALKHPTSGETLGRVETALGVVTVVHVAEHYAVATLTQRTGNQDVQRGDKVRITSGRIALGLVPVVMQPPLQVPADVLTETLRRALEATDRFRVAAQDQTSIWLLQRGEQAEGVLSPDLVPELAQALGVSYVLIPRVRELQGTALLDLQLVSPTQPHDAVATASALLPEASLAHQPLAPLVPVPGLTQPVPTLEGTPLTPVPPVAQAQPIPGQKPTSEPRQTLYGVFKSGPQAEFGAVPWNLADTLTELSRFSLPIRGMDGGDVDGDGSIEAAVLMTSEILLYRLEGEHLQLIDTFTVPQGTLLSVQLLRLGERIGIVVNRQIGTGIDSFVLILQEQRLALWQEHLDNILLAVDTDGDSVNDSLWGQPFDQRRFFREGIAQQYVLADGRLSPQDKVTLPYIFRATGAALARLRVDGPRHLIFVDANHRLRVYRGKEELWKSPENVGGSNIYGETRETISRDEMVSYFYFDPIPAVIDVNGDGIEEVLVPRNVGKTGFVPNITSFSSGDIMLLREEKYGYTLSSVSPQFNGVISGIVALPGNPPAILISVTKYKSFPSRSGESWLYLSRVPVS